MRIEICGGIASGKTTLARALAAHSTDFLPVFEDFSTNTFLSDFYNDIPRYAFETEVSFLLQHMHQIKVAQLNCINLVCDFSLEQDYAYTLSNLAATEQKAFVEVYQESVRQANPANLIVFLECPTQILLQRISSRGRRFEVSLNGSYIDSTVQELKHHIYQHHSNIVTLDSSKYDFREQDDLREVLAKIFS